MVLETSSSKGSACSLWKWLGPGPFRLATLDLTRRRCEGKTVTLRCRLKASSFKSCKSWLPIIPDTGAFCAQCLTAIDAVGLTCDQDLRITATLVLNASGQLTPFVLSRDQGLRTTDTGQLAVGSLCYHCLRALVLAVLKCLRAIDAVGLACDQDRRITATLVLNASGQLTPSLLTRDQGLRTTDTGQLVLGQTKAQDLIGNGGVRSVGVLLYLALGMMVFLDVFLSVHC